MSNSMTSASILSTCGMILSFASTRWLASLARRQPLTRLPSLPFQRFWTDHGVPVTPVDLRHLPSRTCINAATGLTLRNRAPDGGEASVT